MAAGYGKVRGEYSYTSYDKLYAQQPLTTNRYTHFQDSNLRYTGARFSHGASENSVSVLDLHGK